MADGSVVFTTELDTGGLSSGLSGLGGKMAGVVKSAGTFIGTALGAAAAAAFTVSIGAGMNFEAAMSQVAATMGKTVDAIQPISDVAQQLGETTQFTATEAAQAFNYLALAGYDAEKSIATIPTVLDLAAAGGMDLAYASDMITDSMSALGLSTDEAAMFADQMAKTATIANTSVSQLGVSILTVGGTAKYLSGGTVELNAVLGALADNGIKAEKAGTQLRNVITSLVAPTKQGQKAMEKLGVSATDAEGNMRSLPDIMTDLSGALDGMSDAERANVLTQIFNKEDLKSVEALLATTTERWTELTDSVENSGGAASSMATTMMDNLKGDLTLFKSAAEGLALEFYSGFSEKLRGLVQGATGIIQTLTEGLKSGDLAVALGTILNDAWTAALAALKAGFTGLEFDVVLKTEEAKKTLETLDTDIQNIKTKYTSEMITLNLDAKNAETLIAELKALQEKDVLTDADVSRMASITKSLVDMYSGLQDYVGEDGLFTAELTQIEAVIDAYQRKAKAAAASNYQSAIAEKYAEALLKQAELETQAEDYQAQIKAIREKAKAYEELNSAVQNSDPQGQWKDFVLGDSETVDTATIEKSLDLLKQFVALEGRAESLSDLGININDLFGADGETLDAETIQQSADALNELNNAMFAIESLTRFNSDAGGEVRTLQKELESVQKALTDNAPAIDAASKELENAANVVNKFLGVDQAETTTAATEIATAAESVVASAETVKTASDGLATATATATEQAGTASALTDAITTDIASAKKKIADESPLIAEQVSTMAQNISTAIQTALAGGGEGGEGGMAGSMLTLGAQLAQGLATGITTNSGLVSSALTQVTTDAKDAVTLGDFSGLGGQISAGVAAGIRAGSGAIAAALIAAVKSALEATKRFAEIKSPSRLFRDELGRWIPAGAAQGVEMDAWQLREATRNMVRDSVPDMRQISTRAAAMYAPPNISGVMKNARMAAVGNWTQNNTFNVPVQTPDEFAQTMYLYNTYGLTEA